MHGRNTTEENREVVIGSRREAQRLYQERLMYYAISRALIGIPGIIVLYSFPQTPLYPKNKTKNTKRLIMQIDGQALPFLLPKRSIALLNAFIILSYIISPSQNVHPDFEKKYMSLPSPISSTN